MREVVRRELEKVIDLCGDVVIKTQFPQFGQVFVATAMVFTKYLAFLGGEERIVGATLKEFTSVEINKYASMIRGAGARVKGQKSCIIDAVDDAR